MARVSRFLHDPPVEIEPREFAVDEPRRAIRRNLKAGRRCRLGGVSMEEFDVRSSHGLNRDLTVRSARLECRWCFQQFSISSAAPPFNRSARACCAKVRLTGLPLAKAASSRRLTASRSAAAVRGNRRSNQDCIAEETRSWRSASRRCNKTARRWSSGGFTTTASVAQSRLLRSGRESGQEAGGVRAASNTAERLSAARLRRCKRALSSCSSSSASMAMRPGSGGLIGAKLRAESITPCSALVQICKRCVLPTPLAPQSTNRPSGQAETRASQLRAAAFDAAGIKSAAAYSGVRRSGSANCGSNGLMRGHFCRRRRGFSALSVRFRGKFQIDRACHRSAQPKADQHADCGRGEYRKQDAKEAKRRPAGEQGENHPHGMQFHPIAQETRIDHIAFEDLPNNEYGDDPKNATPCRELCESESDRGNKTRDAADVRDERKNPGRKADDQAQIEPHQGKRGGVVKRQQQTAKRLSTNPGRQNPVHFARLRSDHLGIAARQPGIDCRDQARPVPEKIKGNDGCYDYQAEYVKECKAAADNAGNCADQEREHRPRLAAHQIPKMRIHELRAETFLQFGHQAVGKIA